MRNRTRRPLVPILALTIGLTVQIPAAQIYAAQIAVQQAPEYGPPNGTLLIAGGGVRDDAIYERFIELGGGAAEGRFIIVPTAGGNYDQDGNVRVYDEDAVLRSWRARGVRNVSMLQTHDPMVADTEAFVVKLDTERARRPLVHLRRLRVRDRPTEDPEVNRVTHGVPPLHQTRRRTPVHVAGRLASPRSRSVRRVRSMRAGRWRTLAPALATEKVHPIVRRARPTRRALPAPWAALDPAI